MKRLVHQRFSFSGRRPMRTAVKRILLPLALCASLALALVGRAAADQDELAPVWATVNVCDPAANQVGARVGVPGDGSGAVAYARISLQWYSDRQATWLPVEGVASSPWIEVGSAKVTTSQAGWTFQFDQPADGGTKQVRGLAEIQWREGGAVVRSASVGTQAGVASDVGGSAAACALS